MQTKILATLISVIIMTGCSGGNMKKTEIDLTELRSVSQEKWDILSNKKIYFAHQSVGKNIMKGIEDIQKEIPNIKLHILETNKLNEAGDYFFAHSREGRNENPTSKCDEFKNVIDNNSGNINIAFLKFCYADIYANTDIEALFNYYANTFSYLEKKYPEIKFVHFTVPLTTSQQTYGIKAKIKRALGAQFWGEDDNIKRNLFNQMLFGAYSKNDKVFDLARLEATYPNGKELIFLKGKSDYYSLIPEYTEDGSHLNQVGRKFIAEKLLIFLTTFIIAEDKKKL